MAYFLTEALLKLFILSINISKIYMQFDKIELI